MASLEGKIAVITGAARGIGQGIALRFAQEGAKLAAVDILGDKLEQAVDTIHKQGGEAIGIEADITNSLQIDQFVSRAIEHFGRIDILVNNAGIGGSKGCLDTTEEDWDRMVATNLKSFFLVCKRVIPEMLRTGKGKIVNIASMYGLAGSPGAPVYCAAKAGVINLSRQLAVDFSRKNIYVNAISPGLIETEMTRHKLNDSQKKRNFVQEFPIGRPGHPSDISGAAVILVSKDSY
jgi:NAD(P)-dependent dehydrogenase (short-subunit alcohol dehydrogenase family)